jgi:hypothetical protein
VNARAKRRWPRLLLAALAGSAAGTFVAWAGFLAVVAGSVGTSAALAAGPSLLGFFLLIGWPIAAAASLLAGPPLFLLLRHYGILRRLSLVLAAAAVGAVVLPLAWLELTSLLGPLPRWGGAAVMGALSGLAGGWTFWSLGVCGYTSADSTGLHRHG